MAKLYQFIVNNLSQDYVNQLPGGKNDTLNGGGTHFDAAPIMNCRNNNGAHPFHQSNLGETGNVFHITDSNPYGIPVLTGSRVAIHALNVLDPWDEDQWATPIPNEKCASVDNVGGPKGKPRNEVFVGPNSGHSSVVNTDNTEFFAFALYIPSAWFPVTSIVTVEIFEGHGDNGKEAFDFQVKNGRLRFQFQWGLDGSGDIMTLWESSAGENIFDKWHRFVLKTHWSDGNDGSHTVYRDGDSDNPVANYNGPTHSSQQTKFGYGFGIYNPNIRNKSSELTSDEYSWVLAFDEVRVGDSNETVDSMWSTAPDGTPQNNAPSANNDSYSVESGGTLNIAAPGVLSNDSDPDGDSLTAVLDSGPSQASSFTLNADGSFDYTHDGVGTGTDSFTYHANDGTDDSNIATVEVTITSTGTGGSLSISNATKSGDTNLTTAASGADGIAWAHWGRTATVDYNHKNDITDISDIDRTDSPDKYNNTEQTFTWSDGETDGNAVVSATAEDDVARIFQLGDKTSFTVPADKAEKRLKVYWGNNTNTAKLTATLSDGSATAVTETNANAGNETTIDFSAASDGETLTVELEVTSQGASQNSWLGAATLVSLETGSIAVTTTQETAEEINLTSEWTDWSYPDPGTGFDHRLLHKSGGGVITDYLSDGTVGAGTLGLGKGFTAADGPVEQPALYEYENVHRIKQDSPAGAFHEIELPASTTEEVYTVWVAALNTSMNLDVSVDDNSASAHSEVLDSPGLTKIVWKVEVTVTADTSTTCRVRVTPNTSHGDAWLVFMGPAAQGPVSPPANTVPTIDPIDDQTIAEGGTLTVEISGTNTDSSPNTFLTYILNEGPEDIDAEFSLTDNGDNTATFEFTPGAGAIGTYGISVLAHDGQDVAEQTFNVEVTEAAGFITGTQVSAGANVRLDTP